MNTPIPPKPSAGSAPSIISSDVCVIGNMTTLGEIQLEGTVEGDIQCGVLTLGEGGCVKGAVTADHIIIRGTVEGSLKSKCIRLEDTARVSGDICYETLGIEAGAQIDGKMVHADLSKGQSKTANQTQKHVEEVVKAATS